MTELEERYYQQKETAHACRMNACKVLIEELGCTETQAGRIMTVILMAVRAEPCDYIFGSLKYR